MAEVFDFGLQQHKIKMDGKFFENNLFAVAGDTGRRLEVQLLDSDNLVQNTTGISLRLNADVAGQATYAEATLVDATKGLYELDLPNGMLIAPGNWQFQWQIIGANGEKLHSFAFMGTIGSNLAEGAAEGLNFYLNLKVLKQMQEDFISGAFDSEVLETNIAEKLNNLEEQYAPKLTEVTAQLAQIAINVNSMQGATFDEQISNAFVKAYSTGINTVMIASKTNAGSDPTVGKAIEVPSNITLILNNCHIKLGSGIRDNIIVNSGARTSPLSSNENIHIIGIGAATVDGLADINRNFGNDIYGGEFHNDHRRIAINIFNTENFSISNITVREPQGWGISLENGCKKGVVSNVICNSTNQVGNQDGIDIRRGCKDIVLENISGNTGDDLIAMTTLDYEDSYGKSFQVGGNENWGDDNNIENITIKNVKGYTKGRHNVIRFLCKDGNKIKNVNVENVEDTSLSTLSVGNAVVLFGSLGYQTISDDVLGDMSNISIEHVSAVGNVNLVVFESHAENIKLTDINYVGSNSVFGVHFKNTGRKYKNIEINKLTVQGLNEPLLSSQSPSTIYINGSEFDGLFINNVKGVNTRYIIASDSSTIKNMILDGVYVDKTALQIARLTNTTFSQTEPSFIKAIRIKDKSKIWLDTTSSGYLAGRMFRLGAYCYLEGVAHDLIDTVQDLSGGTNSIGEFSKYKITSLPSATNSFTVTNRFLEFSRENSKRKMKIKGEYTNSETIPNTILPYSNSNKGTLVGTISTLLAPLTEHKQLVIGLDSQNIIYNLWCIVETSGNIKVCTSGGTSLTGIVKIFIDLDYTA